MGRVEEHLPLWWFPVIPPTFFARCSWSLKKTCRPGLNQWSSVCMHLSFQLASSYVPELVAKKERMKRLRVCSRGRFRMIQVDMFKSQIVSDTVEYAPPTLHFYLKSQGFGSQGQFEVPARTLGTHLWREHPGCKLVFF